MENYNLGDLVQYKRLWMRDGEYNMGVIINMDLYWVHIYWVGSGKQTRAVKSNETILKRIS